MNSNETKKKLVGPWQSLHVVIWVIGLYILFRQGSFFPGILVLIAISALYEAFIRRYVPEAYVEEKVTAHAQSDQAITSPTITEVPPATPGIPPQMHRAELLPQVCPNCGGPILDQEVKWTGMQTASCPYCGTNLPMNKA